MRCAVDGGKLAAQKRELDGELGARRWAFELPPIRSRGAFWSLLRKSGFRPG